jgi:hypothetical protein
MLALPATLPHVSPQKPNRLIWARRGNLRWPRQKIGSGILQLPLEGNDWAAYPDQFFENVHWGKTAGCGHNGRYDKRCFTLEYAGTTMWENF